MNEGAPTDLDALKDDDPLSFDEAACILLRGLVSSSTLRAAAGRGELTYERIGRRLVVTPGAVRAWRERCRVTANSTTCNARAGAQHQHPHVPKAEGSSTQQTALTALLNKIAKPSKQTGNGKTESDDGRARRVVTGPDAPPVRR